MLSEFTTYFRLGLGHIADLRGYDHILFLVALTAGYAAREWKRLLWLVTAFTLGHSLTLALATLDIVRVNGGLVELLIAVTIVVAGIYGIARGWRSARAVASKDGRQGLLYAMAGGFGLIHGLGFSTFLRSLLGDEDSIVWPLFSFNLGLEVGQLVIVGAILLVGAVLCEAAGLARRRWAVVLSAGTVLLGLQMVVDRLR
jgi:hypothetical protein